MGHFRKSSYTQNEFFDGKHRFEHWYRDNTVYFITSRCRDRFPAFDSEDAKLIFWDRFTHLPARFGFVPFVTTLLNNHYPHARIPQDRGEPRADDAARARLNREARQRYSDGAPRALLAPCRKP
jgi:hypothetical protein